MTDLTAQLADVISMAALEHGENWIPQAEAVLTWLDDHRRLAPDATPWFVRHANGTVEHHWPEGVQVALVSHGLIDQMVAGMNLWHLLGMQPGDKICCTKNGGGDDQTEPAIVCLLPATHVAEGRWHQGLGGTWAS